MCKNFQFCFVASLRSTLERLDEKSAQCFETYIRALVGILTVRSENDNTHSKIGAAKEIYRQLSSPFSLFTRTQLNKWNGLNADTKEHVKDSVSTEHFVVAFQKKMLSHLFIIYHIILFIAADCT